ncbi:MAG: acyltransferase family protein [Vicinamibacterales bacterium]
MRLRSLDAFRGVTMAGMVIVNNPGDWAAVYAPLRHAEWHGWTPTDLIFPWFLVTMGAALALGRAERTTWPAIALRAATIAALGLFMAGFPFFNPARWRVPGVLVRIAICYLAAASVWRVARPSDRRVSAARVAVIAAALLAIYWGLLAWVPPPGGVAGDLAPGRDLGAWLDRRLLARHLYRPDWDPEGLLSTVPAIASTLIGAVAGIVLGAGGPAAARLLGGGAALVVLGLAWSTVLPINKSLWTSSYAVFTAGTAWVALGLLHRGLDGRPLSTRAIRVSEPLVALGRNALLLFVLSGLVGKLLIVIAVDGGAGGPIPLQAWLHQAVFAPLAPAKTASLLYATACLGALYALLAAAHRRRWYWTA